jgi:hypothetical protein
LAQLQNDLLWLFSLASIFYLLVFVFRNNGRIKAGLLFFFSALLFASVLLSILNIEIVQRLGRPLNYQWLYYSDFMNGVDTKNAVAYNVTGELKLNITLLLVSLLIFGLAFSFLSVSKRIKVPLLVTGVLLLAADYIQANRVWYEPFKVMNLASELLVSAINREARPQLFSMDVSNETQRNIEAYHSFNYSGKLDTNNNIKNVILFVLEATPKRYISVYDST